MAALRKKASSTAAFAFDIDGVLVRGPGVLPRVTEMLQLLRQRAVPVAFMTNGGGHTEAVRAAALTKRLGVPVRPEQVCLCHTPMQGSVRQLLAPSAAAGGQGQAVERGKAFLAVGRDEERTRAAVASYGIPAELLFTAADVHAALPRSFGDASVEPPARGAPRRRAPPLPPFGALLLLIDPRDYQRELQICADVLLAEGGVLGTRRAPGTPQDVVCLNACADFEWVSDYVQPRLGAGAFTMALEGVYRELSGGARLEQTLFGKPQRSTYAHVEGMLAREAAELGYADGVHRVYAVGDNPQTDIAGANGAGAHWTSMLVRTGIAAANDPDEPADFFVDDVWDAVQMALQLEGDCVE